MKRFLLLIFTLSPVFSFVSPAQDLTGIWRGYFITEDNDQYRYEVQMEQTKGNRLSGITYSYLGRKFYGKSTMTGSFSVSSGNTLIQEIKTVEVKMDFGSYTCIQKCLLTYTRSGKEEFLEGSYSSIVEKTDTIYGARRGDDCGGGRMYLRKVITSDFYIEPFLRKKTSPKTIVPPVVKNNPPVTKPPATKPPVSPPKNNTGSTSTKTTVITKPKVDPVKKADNPVVKTEGNKNITAKPAINTPAILKSRENNLLQTIIVNNEEITVSLYDNGEIDDDTISVYLDKKIVLSKQRLTAAALTIKLKMDASDPDHELVMVAENLGRIPPNTSLMVVNAGDVRHEVRITSTEQKNAMVRFRYVKPAK
jgi:hypothetical protein